VTNAVTTVTTSGITNMVTVPAGGRTQFFQLVQQVQ
jgi:hypothetical protein